MNKISHYFSTFDITRGLLSSILLSAFIYLHHWHLAHPLLNTVLGLLALTLLLMQKSAQWFWSGAFTGLFWFWWIVISFKHYEMLWAIPIGALVIVLVYGALFWLIAWISEKLFANADLSKAQIHANVLSGRLFTLIVKSLGLLALSAIHPFGFDWLKPELVFVESYIGIEKWQFAIVLLSLTLTLWKKQPLFLLLLFFALNNTPQHPTMPSSDIKILSTHTPVDEKWNEHLHDKQFAQLFDGIDQAIEQNKTLIILPESVFPLFINYSEEILQTLQSKAKKIAIVTGGLYADGAIPRNSAYIFTKERILVAHKVLLVPFGESNPLPKFLSDWVNEVFYDGAVDYIASDKVIDYNINGTTYRNAICFEATSEKLYEGAPKQMIVLSNNGWFTPSTEPTLQKLLLLYYNKKYGTTIYHSVNMSPSYIIQNGQAFMIEDQ